MNFYTAIICHCRLHATTHFYILHTTIVLRDQVWLILEDGGPISANLCVFGTHIDKDESPSFEVF